MTPRASSHRQFHLIDADAAPVAGQPVAVTVPEGVSRLPGAGDGEAPACLLEPLTHGGAPRLLVLAPHDRPVTVNGQWRTAIACLQERDQLEVPDGRTFHVAVHVRCVIGRAPEALAEKPCVVCQQPVGARLVYVCPACESPVHRDRDDPDDVRDCLSVCSECPSCHAPLVRDGYGWLPEG